MAMVHQVGGHANTILASPLSASTLIKPASARELAFYQHLGPSLAPRLVAEWTPQFYGTLTLAGRVDHDGTVAPLDPAAPSADNKDRDLEPEMLVLENLTYRFLRPNILDIKLGTQLFDEDASDDKKERMRRAAASSTSAQTGIRLTAFQVWDSVSQSYVQTPKPFGRALTVSELPLGLARFFYPPFSSASRAELAAVGDSPTSSSSSPPAPAPAPLPLDLLLPVVRTLVRRLDDLINVWSTVALRMRGGSLLVVVEGDPDALEAALLRAQEPDPPRSTFAAERKTDEEEEEAEAETASVSTTDEDGNAAAATRQAFELRLIDFAHTRGLLPGEEGPDEGVLLGLRTVRGLIADLVQKLLAEQRRTDPHDHHQHA